MGNLSKKFKQKTLNINSEEGVATLEDLGTEDYNTHSKLFNSDSESSSVNSEGSNSNTVNPKQKSDKLDYFYRSILNRSLSSISSKPKGHDQLRILRTNRHISQHVG